MKVIKFGAPWCAPCKIVDSYIDENNVDVMKIDIEEDPYTPVKYGVRSVPTVVVLDDDGDIKASASGVEGCIELLEDVK